MSKNIVIRRPNPGVGQGREQATSQRTGWLYEHDETDAQIDAIESTIASFREGHPTATFSWNVDTAGSGNLRLQATYPTNPARSEWTTETWYLAPDGTTIAGVEDIF